jgi:aminocarboxymuconate-semialdehyde decarboxylase
MSERLFIVDFHNHHLPASFEPTTARSLSGDAKARWEAINRDLADEALLLADIEAGDVDARIVNAPGALIAEPDGSLPFDVYKRLNDRLAEVVARHPGKLHGLASVDAYSGETGAEEVRRAVRELGHRGVFVDSARGEQFIDAPEARPTLTAAADLGVPVFVHPVNPQPLTRLLAPYGRIGTLFARGTTNAAALIALVEGGVFAELPRLQVVVTELAFGGLALAAAFHHESQAPGGLVATLRRHVLVDTMGFNPVTVRAAVDLLGADRVVAGSDWPIVNTGEVRNRLEQVLSAAGLDAAAKRAIAGQNALRLLGAV